MGHTIDLTSLRSELHAARNRYEGMQALRGEPRANEAVEELGNTIEELRVAIEEIQWQGVQMAKDAAARARLVTLFEQCPAPYLVTGPEGAIRSANLAAGRLFAKEPRQLVGKPLFARIAMAERRALRDRLSRLLLEPEGMVEGWSVRVLGDDGEVPVTADASCLSPTNGGTSEILWIFRRDGNLRAATPPADGDLGAAAPQADGSAAERKEWLAVVSHEIRNPLTTLLGAAGILGECPLDVEDRELVAVIERSARTVLGLVEDVLDVSQIDAGRFELRTDVFDLREIIEDLTRDLSARTRRSAVDLVWSASPDLPSHAVGDARRLRQALSNVAGNAFKVTEKGEVRIVATPEPDAKDTVRFTISDTGPGIEPERLAAIFRRYSPGGSTRQRFGGTGLGLWITKTVVERMGGTIEVESALGRGSTFILRVPLPSQPGGSEPASSIGPLHALVVTDREPLRGSVADLLRSFGATVTESADGALGAAELERHGSDYDLVLLDVRLPGIGAFGVIDRLGEARDLLAKTIVLLPMQHRQGDVDRLRTLPIAGWLLTPIKRRELLDAVERVRAGGGER